ncbi:hypothetical protein [Alkalihalobacillus sp. TS-13]|nr:hypothetical protein [Alkalihalobacillus sp. TS-13]
MIQVTSRFHAPALNPQACWLRRSSQDVLVQDVLTSTFTIGRGGI